MNAFEADGLSMTCAIVMPTVMPEGALPRYAGDQDHFEHVFEHLFEPAVRAANLEPVAACPPSSVAVNPELTKQLEHADLVLFDLSLLRPHVLFATGVRTALNRPACFVRDSVTAGTPFDSAVVECLEYAANLVPWTVEQQVARLRRHIERALQRSEEKNDLWKWLGLNRSALPVDRDAADIGDYVDLLHRQVQALRDELAARADPRPAGRLLQGSMTLREEAPSDPVALAAELAELEGRSEQLRETLGIDEASQVGRFREKMDDLEARQARERVGKQRQAVEEQIEAGKFLKGMEAREQLDKKRQLAFDVLDARKRLEAKRRSPDPPADAGESPES